MVTFVEIMEGNTTYKGFGGLGGQIDFTGLDLKTWLEF